MSGRGLETSIWNPYRSNVLIPRENLQRRNKPYEAKDFIKASVSSEQSNSAPLFHGSNTQIVSKKNTAPILSSAGRGLATSRWAPRNLQNGLHSNPASKQIWTRTVSAERPKDIINEHAHPATVVLDLGLPYEVQHYILTMIQRILEEGCFEYASRTIPQVLQERNLTCSEAIELSEWRRLLPGRLSLRNLLAVPNYSLDTALRDAVRIRNSAVHRHLCDNFEIRQMTTQAQKLMLMFSDTIRQSKLSHLREELEEWDKLSREDQQSARIRLHSALQQISERPISDMDWTPNLVSLQEVGNENDSAQQKETDEMSYLDDQMDLD